MGWNVKASASVLDDWTHGCGDSPDVDDATLDEKLLGSDAGTWNGASPLYVGYKDGCSPPVGGKWQDCPKALSASFSTWFV
jgi:hypothetical protein